MTVFSHAEASEAGTVFSEWAYGVHRPALSGQSLRASTVGSYKEAAGKNLALHPLETRMLSPEIDYLVFSNLLHDKGAVKITWGRKGTFPQLCCQISISWSCFLCTV